MQSAQLTLHCTHKNLCDGKIQINYRSIISAMTRDRGICQLAHFIIHAMGISTNFSQTLYSITESPQRTLEAGSEDRMLEVEREGRVLCQPNQWKLLLISDPGQRNEQTNSERGR